MGKKGYFNLKDQLRLGLSDEQNQEMMDIAEIAIEIDERERAYRIGSMVLQEFRNRHPDWVQQGLFTLETTLRNPSSSV